MIPWVMNMEKKEKQAENRMGRGYGSVWAAGLFLLLLPVGALAWLTWKGLLDWTKFGTVEWVALSAGLLTYLGTCFMGVVALWQNVRQKAENDKAQEKLDAFNERLANLEFKKAEPVLDMEAEFKSSGGGGGTIFRLVASNVGQTPIIGLRVSKGTFAMDGVEETISIDPVYIGSLSSAGQKEAEAESKTGVYPNNVESTLMLDVAFEDMLGIQHQKRMELQLGRKWSKLTALSVRDL